MDISALDWIGDLLGNSKAEEHIWEEESTEEVLFEEEEGVHLHYDHKRAHCNFGVWEEEREELGEANWSEYSQEEHEEERGLSELNTEESLPCESEK